MKKLLTFGAAALFIGLSLVPQKAEARYYRHHNGGDYAAAAAVGLLSGALIGSQYGGGYGYGGYGYRGYGYRGYGYRGYGYPSYGYGAPAYGYGYAPRYYTGSYPVGYGGYGGYRSYGGYGYNNYSQRCEVVRQQRFHRHGRLIVQNVCVR